MATPKKIIIIGTQGAGKTTVADRMGKELNLPVFYMDRVFFTSDWKKKPKGESMKELLKICDGEKWIIDSMGQNTARDFYSKADLAIFLEISRFLCYFNIVKRRIKCLYKPRHDTPDGSNDRIYFSLLKKVWKNTKKRQAEWHGILKKNEKTTDYIIVKKVNLKTILNLISELKSR